MDINRIFLLCLMGLFVAQSAPTGNSHPHSVSDMLSNLFIEPQRQRPSRSSPIGDEKSIDAQVHKVVDMNPTQGNPNHVHPPPIMNVRKPNLPTDPIRPGPNANGPSNTNSNVQPGGNNFNTQVHSGPPRLNTNLPRGPSSQNRNSPPGPQRLNPNLPPGPPNLGVPMGPPRPQPNLPLGPPRLNPNLPQGPPRLNPNMPLGPPRLNPNFPSGRPNSNLPPNQQGQNKLMRPDGFGPNESNLSEPKMPKVPSGSPDQSKSMEKEPSSPPLDQSEQISNEAQRPNESTQFIPPSSAINSPPTFQREPQFFSHRPNFPQPFPQRGFYERAPRQPLNFPSSLDVAEQFLLRPYTIRKTQCIGTNESMIGECIDPFSCEESGGKAVGICPNGGGSHQVCCSFVSFCDFMTNVERAYLSSPDYPVPVNNLESCAFQLSPIADVCQVRIDFLDFHLKPPVNGECDDDNALHIESNDPNAYIPVKKLCGTLSREEWDPLGEDVPHMYIHFKSVDDGVRMSSDRSPPRRLRYPNKPENLLAFNIKVKNSPSSWNIRINQISCDGGARLQAPFGCAQYFTGENGTIQSLNHRDGSYLSDLDFTSCIMSDPESCGISYKLKSGFSVGNVDGLSFGMNCRGDYLQFSGQKAGFCGSLSSNSTVEFESNKGPVNVHFHSDSKYTFEKESGYSLDYEYLYNCRRTNFFDYNHFSI
nr:uncharacterized protein LOC121117194 [Lepeophtheirus salmonis]